MFRKTMALGMTLLFLGTIITPVVSGNTGNSAPSFLANKASSNTAGESSRGTESCSFVYGPLGNRISSTDANGDTTYYLYEGTNVIQDRQQDGTLAREYVSGVSGKLAMIDHTDGGNKPAGEIELFYYLYDLLGSVVVLTNANGNDCEQYYYDPYGETVITDFTGTIKFDNSLFGNTYMWTGKQYDPANELYHFPARSYSPSLGRWLQRDPLGYVDGLNLYEGLRSNPLKYTDPLGLYPFGALNMHCQYKGLREQGYSMEEAGQFMNEMAIEEGKLALNLFTMFKEPFSTFRDIGEAVSGRDLFSGDPLPLWSRGVTILAMTLPIVSGKWLRELAGPILNRLNRGSKGGTKSITNPMTGSKFTMAPETITIWGRKMGIGVLETEDGKKYLQPFYKSTGHDSGEDLAGIWFPFMGLHKNWFIKGTALRARKGKIRVITGNVDYESLPVIERYFGRNLGNQDLMYAGMFIESLEKTGFFKHGVWKSPMLLNNELVRISNKYFPGIDTSLIGNYKDPYLRLLQLLRSLK